MNDLDKLRELKQLYTIILMYLDDFFSNINTEWVGEIEKVGLTVVEYKNTTYNSLKEIIDKYKDDFSNETYFNLIELPNDERYNIDVLEKRILKSIFNQFKENYKIDEMWFDGEIDLLVGDGLISTQLYYFRLFYEKWYLQSKINNEIDNLIKVK
jgi:hypothetical protein